MRRAVLKDGTRVAVALLMMVAVLVAGMVVPASASDKGNSKVEIYTTSWCTACKQAVAYLRTKRIPFTEYDVEKDPAAARRWQQISPNGGVPVAVIGGQVVRGFSREAYDRALADGR